MLSFLVAETRGRDGGSDAEAAGVGSRTVSSTAPGGFAGEAQAVFTGDTLFNNSVGA
jgi:hypothetical protein